MHRPEPLIHYLLGVPDCIVNAPRCVEVPALYDTSEEANAELGVVMELSRMVHGDVIADSTSWYRLTMAAADGPTASDGDVFLGYAIDSIFFPIAGGWTDEHLPITWVSFVGELERQRASAAELPWSESMLIVRRVVGPNTGSGVDFSYFRFAPRAIELVVRPLHIHVTEPLF